MVLKEESRILGVSKEGGTTSPFGMDFTIVSGKEGEREGARSLGWSPLCVDLGRLAP